MTTNLLSVIEQQHKALEHCVDAIVERGLNGSPDQAEKWGLQLPLVRAESAITAARSVLAHPTPSTFNSCDFEGTETMPAPSTAGELPEPFHPSASHINPDYRDGWNAALAASRSQPTTEESLLVAGAQPVREPLTTDTHYQEWKHGCDSMCTNITLWIDRCPHCGKPRPVVEAAHGITKKGE